jgi:glucose/arabinose dehydrogenase
MKAANVLEMAWLSQLKMNRFIDITKGLNSKQSLCCLLLCGFFAATVNAASVLPSEQYKITTLANELKSPWSMIELPDGRWLITQRDGHVVIVKDSHQTTVKVDLPGLYVAGQGGLLDVVMSPDYTQSKEIIFTYAQGKLEANRLVIAKAVFNGDHFTQPEIIYKVTTDKNTPQHYAGRALILPDNTLIFSSGDGFDHREQAQVMSSQLGKVLRIHLDGSLPSNNPFIDHENKSARAVFSLGHRNTQGLVYDYDTKHIVSHEHGPAGGDELNYLTAGTNYGWPVITYGKDYSQARISPFQDYPGMKKPLVDWTPSIAPSGMAYYGSKHSAFPSLQKHVLITTLVDKKLISVNLASGQFDQLDVFSEISGRLRDVFITSSGNVAVLTDGKSAKLLLIQPE